MSSEFSSPLDTARHDEPADTEIAFLRIFASDYVGNLDEEHHVVLEGPQRQGRRDRETRCHQS
jgi:hypothetical protein